MVTPASVGVDSRIDAIWAALRGVPDPEVPVLSVVELGIVRGVETSGDAVTIVVTPTYSGCPAIREIERDIVSAVEALGIAEVYVRTTYAPAWTTDWIDEPAREKLRAYGIAPPCAMDVIPADAGTDLVVLRRRRVVACPYCGSNATTLRSEFGSTACKAIHFCDACRQPFEELKAI